MNKSTQSLRLLDRTHGEFAHELHRRWPFITPTWVTLSGIIPLALFCITFVYTPFLALAFVVLLGALDILDGTLARTCNLASDAGAYADQAFDKVRAYTQYIIVLPIGFTAGCGVLLFPPQMQKAQIPLVLFFLLLMFGCDFINFFIRTRKVRKHWESWEAWRAIKKSDSSERKSSSSNAGKVKTWLQQISVAAMTFAHAMANIEWSSKGYLVVQLGIMFITIGGTFLWLMRSFLGQSSLIRFISWALSILTPGVLLYGAVTIDAVVDIFWLLGYLLIVAAALAAGKSTYDQVTRLRH